ncbi:hypothetical protein BGY98DRAFT_940038 [Russula aff. rugulosa BPL654]|nr:hypothetical protein BGY98DRAFT_940038 [Russula aff. rugulosa BPL654]
MHFKGGLGNIAELISVPMMVDENDKNRAKRHEKDAEGIVLFTGLFSAALAALIAVSIQDLRPGPQDSTPFSPPTYAIWVNSLWISSLILASQAHRALAAPTSGHGCATTFSKASATDTICCHTVFNAVVGAWRRKPRTLFGKAPKLDAEILDSLLVTLGEDDAREKFFEAVPGFYGSKVVKDIPPAPHMPERHPECTRGNWHETPPSPEIGNILRRWLNITDSSRVVIASCIIARIIATAEVRDDTWKALARSQLGVTEEVLTSYLEPGDNVLLANLIKTTRQFFEKGLQFDGILRSISGFDVKETLPELQHDFCKLWNEIVEVEKSKQSIQFPPTPQCITTSCCCRYVVIFISSGVQPLSLPLERDETNIINPHLVLDTPSSSDPSSPPHELPVEFRTHVPPALGYSYSSRTSHTLATPRDVSVSDPDIIVDAGERDVQDLNAHNPHQSDPPVRYISMGSSRPEKSVI